jgi:hypothetical protein
MTQPFHCHLPDWPPQRLLSEAVLSWNLRHMDEALLDADTSPWLLVRGALLAFLRHRLSAFEDRLRDEYNQELRDALAAQVEAAAHRKYRWLRDDPRPFPEQLDDSQPRLFTELARDLAHDHSVRDQLHSAIRDLKRQGKRAQVETLQNTLAKVERRIRRCYAILTDPKYSHDEHGSQSRGFGFPHLPEEIGRYYFFDDRVIVPNRYRYLGFRCQKCDAPVVCYKPTVDFGQGFRMVVHSCFCHTVTAVCPPAGKHLAPLTLADWDFSELPN